MNVSDIMTATPVTIHKDSTIHEALEAMQDLSCHHLPVTGSEGHLIGILSDHDCRKALNWSHLWRDDWEDDQRARSVRVGRIMTPGPIVIEPDAPAAEAARLMLAHNVRCLPVIRAETLVGIITTTDILMAFVNAQRTAQPLITGESAGM